MIRALITAALAAGAANQLLHVPLDAALGYSVVLVLAGWYLWPLLRHPLRFLLRHLRPHLRRHSHPPARRPAPVPQRAVPATITQINHHHYYNGMPPQLAAPMRADYTLPALPQRTEGRIASDAILDGIIDIDDNTR